MALHKDNVFIDLSGWSPKYFPRQIITYANSQLRHKMMFGSDFPLITPEKWIAAAQEVGKRVAEAAKKAGVTQVVFDRALILRCGRDDASRRDRSGWADSISMEERAPGRLCGAASGSRECRRVNRDVRRIGGLVAVDDPLRSVIA